MQYSLYYKHTNSENEALNQVCKTAAINNSWLTADLSVQTVLISTAESSEDAATQSGVSLTQFHHVNTTRVRAGQYVKAKYT